MHLELEDIVLCVLNWTLWLFQLSMMTFLAKKIFNRHPSFSALFYRLFVIICLIDSAYFIIVTFGIKWPQFGWFARFYLQNDWIAHAVRFLGAYLDALDIVLYAIVAANRYSVMASDGHQVVWYSLRGRQRKFSFSCGVVGVFT